MRAMASVVPIDSSNATSSASTSAITREPLCRALRDRAAHDLRATSERDASRFVVALSLVRMRTLCDCAEILVCALRQAEAETIRRLVHAGGALVTRLGIALVRVRDGVLATVCNDTPGVSAHSSRARWIARRCSCTRTHRQPTR
jgi:hypothetical protein